jgi:hypothetical protein
MPLHWIACLNTPLLLCLPAGPLARLPSCLFVPPHLQVLEQLDGVLREAGSSRGHLVSLQVLLKDVDAGLPPFAAAFKAWVSPLALPAVVPQESYLGVEDVLISVAATAAVPTRQDG